MNGDAVDIAVIAEAFLISTLTMAKWPITVAITGVMVNPVFAVILTPELAKSDAEYVFGDTDYHVANVAFFHIDDPGAL